MKYINKTTLALVALTVFSSLCIYSASGPGTWGYAATGAPFNSGQTCAQSFCHTQAGSYTPTVTVQLLSGSSPVTSYTPGGSYTVQVSMSTSSGTPGGYGFQIVCVQASSTNDINNWGTMPSKVHKVLVNTRHYVEHDSMLSSGTINIPWTAPMAGTASVEFYCVGNIVNGNGANTGDNVTTTTLTVSEATSTACTAPILSTAVTDAYPCNSSNNGAVTLTTSGGSAPFTYSWSGPGSYTSSAQNISSLAPGTYKVIVTATGGCKDSTTTTIGPAAITINASTNAPICHGSNLTFTSSASGGNGTLSYSWAGPNSFMSSIQSPSIVSANIPAGGFYILTVHDANNCIVHDTIHASVDSFPHADSIHAAFVTSSVFNFSASTPRYAENYSWDFGDGGAITDTGNSLKNHSYTTIGTYTVRLIISNPCGSDTVTKVMHVSAIVGVTNVSNETDLINIYPNPAGSFVILENIGNADVLGVSIIDMKGVKVFEKKENLPKEYQINTEQFAPGYYIVHLYTVQGLISSKLLIAR